MTVDGFGTQLGCTTGAQIITNTIVGLPYYTFSIIGPKNPILLIKAPILIRAMDV